MERKQRGIVPRKIKGFRDIDPGLNSIRWHIIRSASEVYKLYGFEHWDTPALEYAENLGKYLPDTDTVEEGVYSFKNPEAEPVLTADGRELRDEWDHVVMENHFLSLRYDLTAPLARLYAENLWHESLKGNLATSKAPLFRRYQYGPVYRFEAKLDPGRFREFWQLDFDTVGSGSPAVDAETCAILAASMEAIGMPKGSFLVKVNNRKVLKGFLATLGILDENREQSVLRIIDKFDKIGVEGIFGELVNGRTDESGAVIPGLGMDASTAKKITGLFGMFTALQSRPETIENIKKTCGHNDMLEEGLSELSEIDQTLRSLGFGEDLILFDPTLVRGMAYYTGPVFEVVSNLQYTDEKGRQRKVGSVCGGGRYDGLVERLLNVKIPATGASIGVDRLAELLSLTGWSAKSPHGPVIVVVFDENMMPAYNKIAAGLRNAGISAEIYYGMQRGLKKQLSYADKKNCPFAIFLGEDELAKGVVTVKNLRLGREITEIADKEEWKKKVQSEVGLENIVAYIRDNL
ncbi:MAG: histidine--tRNA ligase [Bacteroidales bacterium]|nr:histidine--tRNA ligase [Bacteroidales bacterium]